MFTGCFTNVSQEKEKLPPIPRSEWDSNNIAYTNTDSITLEGYVYPKTKGGNGIVGTFHREAEKFAYMYSYTEIVQYDFYDTGYYKRFESGFKGQQPKSYQKEEKGTYKIYYHSDSYFIIDFFDSEGTLKNTTFYQVKDNNLHFSSFYRDESGTEIRPNH